MSCDIFWWCTYFTGCTLVQSWTHDFCESSRLFYCSQLWWRYRVFVLILIIYDLFGSSFFATLHTTLVIVMRSHVTIHDNHLFNDRWWEIELTEKLWPNWYICDGRKDCLWASLCSVLGLDIGHSKFSGNSLLWL